MYKFLSFIKEFQIPTKKEISGAVNSFSKKELSVFVSIIIVAFLSMMFILNSLNNKFLVEVPVSGGTITEGIIGMPTLVNPVLAISDADKDLVSLVYSGLMRRLPNGTFVPDLAESYSVSPNGLNYTFILRKDISFHDGVNVTVDDIIFTINKIKDPATKSPQRVEWTSIEVEKKDDLTISFNLKQPYISFLDNTTIGIIPSHIWSNINANEFNISPYNIKAIGSGPYKFDSVTKNKDGIPEKYSLKSFSNFSLGNPNIKKLNIISFSNEKDLISAILNGSVDQAGGITPEKASLIKQSTHTIHTSVFPRIFGIFYNSVNNKIFKDVNVISAINYTLDKEEIIDEVLDGYGTNIDSPIPETILKNDSILPKITVDSIAKANEILDKSGWKIGEDGYRSKGGITTVDKNTKVGNKTVIKKVKVDNGPILKLEFSLSTGNTPELKKANEIIKKQLAEVGINVNIEKVYEIGTLNQVIRNREYEAIFFGQIIKHESDLFSFWHSSQIKNPGLNISMYGNAKVDKILEEAQKTLNIDSRNKKYLEFIDIFHKDLPALLIYSPKYLYITTNNLNNITIDTLINPSDRFASIYTWYANTEHVWKFFTK